MANTYVDYTGNGSETDFNFSFPYIKTSHVVVEVNEGQGGGGLNKWVRKTLTTDYSVQTSPTTFVRFVTAPGNNVRVRVLRDSDASTGLVDFANGSVLTETELDNSYEHNRYLAEEAEEGITGGSLVKNTDGQFDADGLRLENLADPDSDDDAVNKGYADNRYVDADGDTMTGALTLSADPINNLHAATKQYTDTKVSKAGDTMSGDLNMGSNKITDLSDPVNPQEAATKAYVDAGGVGIATENYVNQQISNTITGSSVESSKYTFTGNGSDTAFILSPGIDLDGDTMYDVFIDGICQEPTEAYVINAASNTITFTGTPPNGSKIVIVQRGYAVPVSDKITTNDIEDDAVTYAKLQNVADNNVLLGNDNGTGADVQELTATEARTLLNVEDGATANDTDDNLKNRANHTGTQSASTISDFDTEVANNTAVAANTAKVSNATHTGDVTGSTLLTIANDAVTPAKVDSTGNYTVEAIGIGGATSQAIATYPLQVTDGTSFAYLKSNNAGGSSFVLENENTGSTSLGITYISRNNTTNTTNNRFELAFRHVAGAFYLAFKDQTAPTVTKKAVALQLDGHFRPDDNGSQDLGVTAIRWDDVWSNGTFNGSDRNIKQDIQDLDEAEKRVAVKCKGLIKKYRLRDAVAKKGNDARIHVGIIAQDLQAAFESEGLDPFRYSMIGKDTWWEGTDAEGNRDVKYEATAGYTEVTQMSVRYNELLAFIISAL